MAELLGTVQTPLHELADSSVAWQRVGARTSRVSSLSLGCPLPPHSKLAMANSKGNVPQSAAPPQQNKNEERAKVQGNSLRAGLTILVGNLPAGCSYKELKSHAKLAGTAPSWAVVFKHHDASTGAIGFDTPEKVTHAVDILNGALFQGTPVLAAPWTYDAIGHSIARA